MEISRDIYYITSARYIAYYLIISYMYDTTTHIVSALILYLSYMYIGTRLHKYVMIAHLYVLLHGPKSVTGLLYYTLCQHRVDSICRQTMYSSQFSQVTG
jgi:hypothetical protein